MLDAHETVLAPIPLSNMSSLESSADGPTLVLLHGGAGAGEAERMVARARLAAARLNARAAREAGFADVILATADAHAPADPAWTLDRDPPDAPFSPRERLLGLAARLGGRAMAVMGAGALPLLTAADFAAVREALAGGEGTVTNNLFSADLTAWRPATALARTGPFARDNAIPRRLRDEAGLPVTALPRSVRTAFDLDTPAELAALALSEATPAALRAALPPDDALPLATWRAFPPLLCDPNAEVLLAGRIGSAAWAHLERETACRVRVVSEERGLASAPDDHAPRSIMGRLLDDLGAARFAEELAALADGVALDTRVLLAHARMRASREDRFRGDLLKPARVADPWLRDLTAALAEARVPVLTGGHTLLNGGMMALADQAWLENDRRLAR